MTAHQDPAAALHPLQQAFLAGDVQAVADRFATDAVLYSPAFSTPFRGKDELTRRLFAVADTLEDVEYTGSFREGPDLVWRFNARVGRQSIEGIDIFRFDEEGRITELTVLVRPLAGLAALVPIGTEFAGGRLRALLLRSLAAPLALAARLCERLIARLALGRGEGPDPAS